MNKVKSYLVNLHEGRQVDLDYKENQQAEMIAVDVLSFEDGHWLRSQLNCWSSQDYGFGTCRCISHPAFRTERITRKEVLSHLRQLLRYEAEDRATRDAEIAWLDEQIKAIQ